MTTRASPAAYSSPASTAAWCPKFREKERRRTRSSRDANSSMMAGERSVLPSLTKTSSKVSPSPSITAVRRRQVSGNTSSSLRKGTMTENTGVAMAFSSFFCQETPRPRSGGSGPLVQSMRTIAV